MEGKGHDRGWHGWMASPTQWTWIWASSGSWWWTGWPGVLQYMGSQKVGHNWATQLNWTVSHLRAACSTLTNSPQCDLGWELCSTGLIWAGCWLIELSTSLLERWKMRWLKGNPSEMMKRNTMRDRRLFREVVGQISRFYRFVKYKAAWQAPKFHHLHIISFHLPWGTNNVVLKIIHFHFH